MARKPSTDAALNASIAIDHILTTARVAARDIVRARLSREDQRAVCAALHVGVPINESLAGGLLPMCIRNVVEAIGQLHWRFLVDLLGSQDAADRRLSAVVQGEVYDLVEPMCLMVEDAPRVGVICRLTTGHLRLLPAGPQPEGSVLIATLTRESDRN